MQPTLHFKTLANQNNETVSLYNTILLLKINYSVISYFLTIISGIDI